MAYMATTTSPPIITPPVAPTSTSDAALFHKGNKRDISVYPVLKDILSFSTMEAQVYRTCYQRWFGSYFGPFIYPWY